MEYLLTGLGLGIVTLAWVSFVYLNFDIADKRIDGWLHAGIFPFLFFVILWGLIITLQISLIGGFIGSKMFKKE